MSRKETFLLVRPATVLVAGVVLSLAGLGLLTSAAAAYRANLQNAAVLADTGANVFRVDVGCVEPSR